MNIGISAEINFHDQDRASVLIESTATGDDAVVGELLFFIFYAIRSIANLSGTPIPPSLGSALNEAGASPATFAETVPLIENPGHPGRKRFVATLRASDTRTHFELKPKGFGLGGRGLQFYSPSSVLVLFAKLVQRHADDQLFLQKLGDEAMACGYAQSQGYISVATQFDVAIAIMNELMATE